MGKKNIYLGRGHLRPKNKGKAERGTSGGRVQTLFFLSQQTACHQYGRAHRERLRR